MVNDQSASEESNVVSAARALSKLRWSKLSRDERRNVMAPIVEKAAKKRRAEPRALKKARATAAAKAISPEAAKARALKAWETKRRKAELRNAS